MRPNPQETADLVTFNEEILSGKLHFLCSDECRLRSAPFDYKIFTKQIEFLRTMVYRDQQHKIKTMIFRKPTDQQTYLHVQSNHPKSLKDSIPYSQALCIKVICSTASEFNKNCDIIRKRFKERGYTENLVNEQVDKVKNMKRKQLLLTNNKKNNTESHSIDSLK